MSPKKHKKLVKNPAHKSLLNKAKKGDKEAFDELMKMYKQKLHNTCYSILKDKEDTKEVLQTVFLIVYEKLHTFKGLSSFYSWIHHIATNASLMLLRKRKNVKEVSLDEQVQDLATEYYPYITLPHWAKEAGEIIVDKESSQIIKRTIEELPENYRRAFYMSEIEGIPDQEIAKILNISLTNVKSRIHRARKMLREKLAEYFRGE